MEKNLRFLQLLFQLFPNAVALAKKEPLILEKVFQGASIPLSLFQDMPLPEAKGTAQMLSNFFEERVLLEESIHPSWQKLFQERIPQDLRPLSTMLFSTHEEDEESEEEGFTPFFDATTALFCRDRLLARSSLFEMASKSAILNSKFLWILSLSHKELLHIVDLIGMIDVAEEVRQTVDKKELQTLFSFFQESQLRYVKSLLYTQSKVEKRPVHIMQKIRAGTPHRSIRSDLHKTGLLRFAEALRNESALFLWHVIHMFDMPRGIYIERELKRETQSLPSKNEQDAVKELLIRSYQFMQNEQNRIGES